MSTASDGNTAGQSSGQAGEADSLELDGRRAIEGHGQAQASVQAGWVAETRRAAAEGQAAIDPLVADQALATAEQKRDGGTRPPSEPRPTPESALADVQALKSIDSRHESLQALVPGTLGGLVRPSRFCSAVASAWSATSGSIAACPSAAAR